MTIRVGDYRTTPEDEQSVLEVLRSNRLSEGPKVREFEEKWADFCGTKYCVLTNSGTSALIACLEVMKEYTKIRKVLTSPLTFIATINAIVLSGYEPVFSDVNKQTFVIEPTLKDADLFLPVHLYGYPVDMDKFPFRFMIEDCCEAHASLYNGKKVGSIGTMGCFSFYVAHNVSGGCDMGCITTNSKTMYQDLKKIKAHGRLCECPICGRLEGRCPHKDKDYDPRFTHIRIAYNFKTSELQAVLALNQLKIADEIIKKRQENVKYLNDGLAGIDALQLPIWSEAVSYLAYPLIIKDENIDRNAFCHRLEKAGIETRPLFACVPLQQPAYAYLKEQWMDKLPNAQWLGERGMHVGVHQYLTKEDLDYIIYAIKETLKDVGKN